MFEAVLNALKIGKDAKKFAEKISNDSAETDTDSSSSRLQRAQNQYNFEQEHLQTTFGLPFKERFLIARASLFQGFANVIGEDYKALLRDGKIFSDKRPQIHDEYIPKNEVAERALNNLVLMIDDWYQEISQIVDEKEKAEATLRFISVMFVCGIMIHPTRDGNGQTFKMLALSYLHDLSPVFKSRFIPIKYDQTHHDQQHEMASVFMGGGLIHEDNDLTAGSIPPVEAKDTVEQQLLDALKRVRKAKSDVKWEKGGDIEVWEKEVETRQEHIINEIAQKLDMPDLTKKMVSFVREEGKLFKKKTPIYRSLVDSFEMHIFNILQSNGHQEDRARITVWGGPGMKIERATYAVEQLMTSDRGKQILDQYVKTGQVTIPDARTIDNVLFRKAVMTFEKQVDKILTTLETAEEHMSRHAAMIQLLTSEEAQTKKAQNSL